MTFICPLKIWNYNIYYLLYKNNNNGDDKLYVWAKEWRLETNNTKAGGNVTYFL